MLGYQELLQLARVDVPEAKQGSVEIRRVTVSKEEADWSHLRSFVTRSGRSVSEGTYTQLIRDGKLWMSDTPDERRDLLGFILKARGKVLVHGLGIGMCISPVLSKPEVEHLMIVEIDRDVIDLVAPHYLARWGDRLSIVHGDALTYVWPKGARWDVVWHDIWSTISEDNLETMGRLHRRFGRRCDWQGSWCRERILAERRSTRNAPWR